MNIPSEDVSTIYQVTEKKNYNKLIKILQEHR